MVIQDPRPQVSKYKCVFGVELQVGGDHVPAKLPKSPEPKSKAGAPPNPKALNPLSPKPLDPEVLTPTPSGTEVRLLSGADAGEKFQNDARHALGHRDLRAEVQAG